MTGTEGWAVQTTTSKAARSWGALGLLVALIFVVIGVRSAMETTPPSEDVVKPPNAGSPPTDGPPTDGAPPDGNPNPGQTNVFAEADQRMSQMVDTRATWHAPSRSPVAETIEVGLSIGDGEELRRQVEEALPESPTQPGVPLRVGTDVSARLLGDQSDVSITPDDAIDASTGSDIALLWTWDVRPKHPAEQLRLSAHLSMTVPGTEHKLRRTLHLYLNITRTVSYTVHQVFANYGTWAAIAAAVFGAGGWLWRNYRRRRQEPHVAREPRLQYTAPAKRRPRADTKQRKRKRDPHGGRVASGTTSRRR